MTRRWAYGNEAADGRVLAQLLLAIRSRFTERVRLEAENLLLRQQLIVLRRKSPRRVRLRNIDRLLLVWLYRLYPSLLAAIIIVQPETVIRWHGRGFRAYWRWKSRQVGGRPRIDFEMRALIRRMSRENPLWGAPRIHGELLMLGIEVAESTVGRYMVRRRRPPSQGWKTFPRDHAAGIASKKAVKPAAVARITAAAAAPRASSTMLNEPLCGRSLATVSCCSFLSP